MVPYTPVVTPVVGQPQNELTPSVYLIWGPDACLVDQRVSLMAKTVGVSPLFFTEDTPPNRVLMVLKTIPFLNVKKLVVWDGLSHLLVQSNITVCNELRKFAVVKNPNVVLVIRLVAKTLPSFSTAVQKVLDMAKTFFVPPLTARQMVKHITNKIKNQNGNIKFDAAVQLALRLPPDCGIINNEVQKLLLESPFISVQMVEKSVAWYTARVEFALSKVLVKGNAQEIFATYKRILRFNISPVAIIYQLGKAYTLALLVDLHKKLGYNLRQSAALIQTPIWRLFEAEKILKNQVSLTVPEIIVHLANADQKIKSGAPDLVVLNHLILNLVR